MKRFIFTFVFVLGTILRAQAYTDARKDHSKPPERVAEISATLQRNPGTEDRNTGARGVPTAAMKSASKHDRKVNRKRESFAPRPSSNVVIYNRDSKDPNVGWHWEGGLRTCYQDCDNPEIPGSGYVCRNVQVFGLRMRECDSSN